MKRYDVEGDYSYMDECENGDWVKYEDAKEVCDEAAKIIKELCTCFKVQLPEATLERLKI